MKVTKFTKPIKTNKFSIRHARAALVPTAAITMLGVFGVLLINQDIDENASASNATNLTGTVSYGDEYITISNSSTVNLGTAEAVTADASYIYATDNVTVSTNVASGFELYLTSANNDNAALTTPSSYTTIAATSGTGGDSGTPAVLDRNSYGYAVPSGLINNTNFDASYASPSASSKFAAVPAGTSDRIRTTSEANTNGVTTDVHYGASLTNALAPGTYTGQVIYSAVVTPTSGTYEISVSPSSGTPGDTLTVESGPTTIATDASLDASEVQIEFRQNGKTKGACITTSVDVASDHLVTNCTAPNLPIGSYDVVVLVSRFGFKEVKTSAYTSNRYVGADEFDFIMQSMTSSTCSSLATFDPANSTTTTYTGLDTRDYNTYYIRKLADGHCWMVQNLRLIDRTISSGDSDISSTFIVPASSSSANNSTGVGDGYWCNLTASVCFERRVVQYNDNTTYGAYYNWYTATAGTGTYSMTSGNVTSSICPKGWKLPRGDTSEYSWFFLYASDSGGYSSNISNFQTATNTGSGYLAGNVINGSLSSDGSNGFWWSRTASGTDGGASLSASGTGADTRRGSMKWAGFSVRCVLSGN